MHVSRQCNDVWVNFEIINVIVRYRIPQESNIPESLLLFLAVQCRAGSQAEPSWSLPHQLEWMDRSSRSDMYCVSIISHLPITSQP